MYAFSCTIIIIELDNYKCMNPTIREKLAQFDLKIH